MKMFKYMIRENTWLGREYHDFGWGNGYVAIPEGCLLHGLDYDTINEWIDVHGGLTYSNLAEKFQPNRDNQDFNSTDWVVGFDTAHFSDTLSVHTERYVLSETRALQSQLYLLELKLQKESEGCYEKHCK